ncbi:hypothetical protein B0H10DRAFT_2018090 [Mycena sp. CBHHK59/15]|nr:hypothetical protein B0H10DRAFT_2018090 [Mycena sp. CBHHK59/15]
MWWNFRTNVWLGGKPRDNSSWLRDTDDNPAWATDHQVVTEWITEQAPNCISNDDGPPPTWIQDPDENTEWAVTSGPNDVANNLCEDDNSGWLQNTDDNPAWNIGHQQSNKWTDGDEFERAASPADHAAALEAQKTWDLPWPDAVPDVKPSRKAQRCKYFGQGHCSKGDACDFLHVINSTYRAPQDGSEKGGSDNVNKFVTQDALVDEALTAVEPDDPSRSIYHCMVRFGTGVIPDQVTTAFESHTLILSNLPPGIVHADLTQLAEPYGVVKSSVFHLSPTGIQAHLEFEEYSQASDGLIHLDGLPLEETVLNARLDSVGTVSSYLVWDAPSVSGWVFYPSVRMAKDESSRLNGQVYGDRKLTAEYHSNNQKHSFPIRLGGLPVHVNKAHLHEFCVGSSSVFLNLPNYQQSPIENIIACLAEFGQVNSFEMLPTDPSHLKITGFVEFSAAKAVSNAVQALKGVSHAFLGNGSISVQPVFHSKYDCSTRAFAVIRDDLDQLCQSFSTACTIRYYDQDRPRVHVYSRQPKTMARATNAVQALLFGFEMACWDSYFDMPSSNEALKRINSDASFYVQKDQGRRMLRIWGNREKCEKQISRLLKRVQAQRHSFPLHSGVLSALLNGGLQSLHDAFGPSKVLLDVRSQRVVILGDIKSEFENHIQAAVATYSRETVSDRLVCCLCSVEVGGLKLPCAHIYCSACLKHLLGPIPGIDFVPPCCIADVQGADGSISRCLGEIPLVVVSSRLTPEEQVQLFESSFLSFVRSQPNFRFCISGCPVIYRSGVPGTILTCPKCVLRICASCDVSFHAGLTCAEYQTLKENNFKE